MIRRMWTAVLALATVGGMLFSGAALAAEGELFVRFAKGEVTEQPGGTVTLAVTVTQCDGFLLTNGGYSVRYDAEALELVGTPDFSGSIFDQENDSYLFECNPHTPGEIKMAFASIYGYDFEGTAVLLRLTFRLREGHDSGEVTLEAVKWEGTTGDLSGPYKDVVTEGVAEAETMVLGAPAAADITAAFTDGKFRACVYEVIGKTAPAPIYDIDVANIKQLDVGTKEIASLAGIEHFVALEELECGSNSLTALDVSENKALRLLFCEYNLLTELDVSENVKLERLACGYNALTALQVKGAVELRELACGENELTSLDVSENIKLQRLYCVLNRFADKSAVIGASEEQMELNGGMVPLQYLFDFFPQKGSPAVGDVNADDKIDSTDARLILQYEVKLLDLTEQQIYCAEVSRIWRTDWTVDSTDARLILQYEVRLILTF